MLLLEIKGLKKRFRIHQLGKTIQAVEDFDFILEAGQFIGIIGKSGSGKSTILKSIYRTYLPDAGKLIYNSKTFGKVDLAKVTDREILYLRKNEIGYVSQFLNIMPRNTCRQLVEKALLDTGETGLVVQDEAEKALTHFELDPELWDAYPSTFSGGEKLRLNIAIAIVKRPRLLLLDEPTASLDQNSKTRVREMIEKLKESGTTMIGIFHDIKFMEGLCDEVYELENRQIVSERA